MKLLKIKTVWIGLFYFFILLVIALFVRDIPNQYGGAALLNLDVQQILKTSSFSDPTFFATAAMDIAQYGWITSANNWIFNLWPPGFALLEASIIKLFGVNAPIVLVLQVMASALFSILLTMLFRTVNVSRNCIFSLLIPLTIFVFPVSRVFLLQPVGISFGESFAIGFFGIGILQTMRSVQQENIRNAVYAGFCFALSAYFRSQFEIILLAMTCWGLLLALLLQLKRFKTMTHSRVTAFTAKTILTVIIISHAATIPWRVYHWVNDGTLQWVTTSSVTYGNSVRYSDELVKNFAGFVSEGGGNLACQIDPTTCGDVANAKRHFFKTLLAHPVEWYSFKLGVIGKYWFSSAENWTSVVVKNTSMDYFMNLLLLISIVGLVVLLFKRRVRLQISWTVLVWFNLTLFSTYALIFTVQQFEVRYFYFPKIMGYILFLVLANMYCKVDGQEYKSDV